MLGLLVSEFIRQSVHIIRGLFPSNSLFSANDLSWPIDRSAWSSWSHIASLIQLCGDISCSLGNIFGIPLFKKQNYFALYANSYFLSSFLTLYLELNYGRWPFSNISKYLAAYSMMFWGWSLNTSRVKSERIYWNPEGMGNFCKYLLAIWKFLMFAWFKGKSFLKLLLRNLYIKALNRFSL